MGRFTILITKKISPSVIAALSGDNISVLSHEFIQIIPLINESAKASFLAQAHADDQTAVIFTSKHAVSFTAELVPPSFARNNIFCLKGVTSEYVTRYFGDDHIAGMASNAAGLARCILDDKRFQKALFFCGDKRREDLPAILKQHAIDTREVHVYQTIQTPAAIGSPLNAVVFFSPSAVESFFTLNELNETAVCFAIGATTAAALGAYTPNKIVASPEASEEKMMETVSDYIQQSIIIKDKR